MLAESVQPHVYMFLSWSQLRFNVLTWVPLSYVNEQFDKGTMIVGKSAA